MSHTNILAVYYQATASDIYEGKLWYQKAHNFCKAIESKYNVNALAVACIIAALSPRNRWEKNLLDAENLIKASYYGESLEDIKVSTYGRNKAKAMSFLDPEAGMFAVGNWLKEKDYSKVRSFAKTIATLEDNWVTVDVHASSIWRGFRQTKDTTPYHLTPKRYSMMQDDYRKAAKIVGIKAYEMQAITWITHRRIHNI